MVRRKRSGDLVQRVAFRDLVCKENLNCGHHFQRASRICRAVGASLLDSGSDDLDNIEVQTVWSGFHEGLVLSEEGLRLS